MTTDDTNDTDKFVGDDDEAAAVLAYLIRQGVVAVPPASPGPGGTV